MTSCDSLNTRPTLTMLDTAFEVEYFCHGGILNYVLRGLLA
jgi:aconitase A